MRRHFIQRQCPLRSLLTRPDLAAQRARFSSFQRVDAADMTAILAAASSDELKRVSRLEPFDEYEEFHLKCTHYFCLAALNGRCSRANLIWPNAAQNNIAVQKSLGIQRLDELGISRFGLTASYTSGYLVLCGGHGTCTPSASETHGRQTTILCRKMNPQQWNADYEGQGLQHVGEHKAAMYCSSTAVGSKVFVFGGRLGPHQPTNALTVCSFSGEQPSVEVMDSMIPSPTARWRHSATLVHSDAKKQIVVLGGRGADSTVFALDVAWFLDPNQLSWRSCAILPACGSHPCPRHSHAAAPLGDQDLLMICGGMDKDENLLGDAWVLHRKGDRLLWRPGSSPLPRPRPAVKWGKECA